MNYERITAADIRPGDRIARARTHTFREVAEVRRGEVAVRLIYVGGSTDRPRQTAQWWKESA